MKKTVLLFTALTIILLLSACHPKVKTPDMESGSTVSTVPQTFTESSTEAVVDSQVHETGSTVKISETTVSTVSDDSAKPRTTKTETTMALTEVGTTGIVGDPTKPQTTQPPSTYTGTTIVDVFVITKVSGTYLEMQKYIIGNDTEKLVYCCNIGHLDGSADMTFKVGDTVTLRYDQEVAETYPLQLTVREIYPATWN